MPSIVFDNAKIVTEEKTISNGFLVVTDHRIAQVGEGPATREELGAVTGRDVVSVAAVTDVGMAAAFVRKLAEADGRFARAAQELSRPDPAGQTPRGRHKREH